MLHNQKILAQMIAEHAVNVARYGVQASPHARLMSAVEDAITDARERRDVLVSEGGAGSESYLKLNAQIARWEAARRSNR